ncbi:MAG TPA: hypothetical protein VGK99_18875 [Acidobacteriota bacterium]
MPATAGFAKVPLFVCHANCCRSAMAKYLYEGMFAGSEALSAGIEVGEQINDRALAMLRHWGVDGSAHQPRRLTRELCDTAGSIFLMSPEYLDRLLQIHGRDLASKAYLFADPFSVPESFGNGGYSVYDPSFENRPVEDLAQEFDWFRRRVVEIHAALASGGRVLVPANRYIHLLLESKSLNIEGREEH